MQYLYRVQIHYLFQIHYSFHRTILRCKYLSLPVSCHKYEWYCVYIAHDDVKMKSLRL